MYTDPDAVALRASPGFGKTDLVSGAPGDRTGPVALLLPIGQIAAAAEGQTD